MHVKRLHAMSSLPTPCSRHPNFLDATFAPPISFTACSRPFNFFYIAESSAWIDAMMSVRSLQTHLG